MICPTSSLTCFMEKSEEKDKWPQIITSVFENLELAKCPPVLRGLMKPFAFGKSDFSSSICDSK